MKRAWTTLRLIVAAGTVATSATLPARGDYLTFDIASHEAMADYTRFESRSWAADAVGEGGRLERNTVWLGGEHVIVSDIYIPSGVTLTINAGTVVKFREGTRIKVEDGGSLVINGASGNEVVLEGYDDDTRFTGIVLQSSAASYSDNCFVIVRGFNFGRYATVSLNNTTAFLGGGQALVPVDVSGSRDTAFSFDWVAETNGVTFASGTMSWNRVSDGRKNITVPYPDGLPGRSNFVIRAVTFRCCSPNVRECVVTLSEFVTADIFSHEAMADYIAFESREWAAGMEGEGGRLATNATWSGTHKIVSDVYIPSGVTLTLTADTVVEFCEGTRIKIEDGGTLNIVGADGHDVILRGAEGVANFGGIVKMPNGTFTDNSYFRLEGFTYGTLANVALHDSSTFRSSGLALIPVTVSGSRSTAFSIDWVAETNGAPYKTGTLKWNGVSEGTKNISINYGAELDGYTNFTLRAAVDRACKTSPNTCTIKISDFIVSDIASHESMAEYIRFESRDWAADLEGEGGRLAANATWEGTHKIASDVYIPSGVTLTLAADAVVEFYEGTRIKIEDGGTLNIVGANGHDVVIRGAAGVSNYVGVVKMPNGTYTDNMYVQYTDRPYSAYPYITVHEATTYREAGKMWIAFSLSGTMRNQSFNVDWSTDKGDSGTLTWSSSSDGTKWIEIPIAAEPVGGTTNHVINVTAARGCNISVGTSVLTVLEPDYNAKGQVALTEGDAQSNDFAVNGGIKTQPLFLNDVETVQYSGKWQPYDENEAAVLRVTLETDNGATVLKEASPSETGAFDLNLKQYPVGYYTLKHEILNDLGETLATMQKTFSIADDEDVVLHGGVLTSNEVWAADKVHVVYETVVVPSIYTIFIEPGAIVKFMTGTGIDISQGGAFFANRIVFTHINDDTVGGDTLNDGFTVAPPMDAYFLSGAFTFGDDTELRGITQNNALTGTIATQKTLSRGSTYRVSGTLTIASGGSLTIPPGTVLKMEDKAAIVVNSGATLNAIGTRAAPITFTSIKDDTISGDTNGDGSNTIPQPGDWEEIKNNGGTMNLAFVTVLYGGYGQYSNQGDAIIRTANGKTTMDSCVVKHSNLRLVGRTGGTVYAENCTLEDGRWGIDGAVTFVNSVIANCNTGANGATLKNSILWVCDTYASGGTASNCVAYGETTAVQVGMTYADPLFVDPANGDFRVKEGSPCVDAADGAVAPELDFYGQPRITITDHGDELVGQLADIGICEVMPRDVVSDIDLVPQSVRTTTNAVPGQLLFVKWEIANVGGREVEAAWRDTVSLVSESGREVVLGVKTTSSRIGVGGSVFCSGYFTVPAVAEGTWYPKVNVNSYHDIFEGSLAANNALTGERAVSVGLEALDPSISREGEINGGTPTVLKLAYGEDAENRMVKFDVPAGVKATWGFGFMPGGSRSVATASGFMTATSDGVMFRVPDGATDVYVVLESDTTTTYNLSTESTQMTITSVTPATLPSSGTTTLTISGAGFGDTNDVTLISSVGRVVLNAPQKDASGNLIATIDCATLTAGQTYAVRVESGENAADLPGAVSVFKAEGKGYFWHEMVLPQSGRTGRASVGYVVYGNSGTANMIAPIIDIVSTGDGKIAREIDGDWSLLFRFLAVGGGVNPMILSPGEEGRIDFYIMTQQKNEFSIYTSCDKQLQTGWPSQTAFEEAMVEAGNRLAWRGEEVSNYEKVYALAKLLRDGDYDNSIGGIVRGSAGEGVENAIVDLYQLSDDLTNKVQSVVASAFGRFVFNRLEDGRYLVGVAGKITEGVIVVADGVFTGNVDLTVNTDRSITATPAMSSSSDEVVSITLISCLDPNVVVAPIAIRQGNECVFDSAIDSGFYRVHCVVGNKEGFEGVYVSSNSDVEVSVPVSQPASISGVVTDLNTYRLPGTDVILAFRGSLSGRTYTVIPDTETGAFEVEEMVSDSYVVTYSGLTCSYEPDMELVFDGDKDYQVTFSPVPVDKTLTVSYPAMYNNHMLVVAGPEGVLTAEVLDGSGPVGISRVKNGVWSFVVVDESGAQVAAASLELTDEKRSCQIVGANMSATMPMTASLLGATHSHPRLKGIGGWLADKFKALTHWLGEALADLLPISIMDFFETKEWKEGMDISNTARSYLNAHTKIRYPGPCCCGYNDQKYPCDKAALNTFVQQVNDFSTYVQSCSSMKVVASTSKSIADIADNIGEQVISSYTGGLLNKMVQINNIRVRFIALAAYVKAAKDLGADYEKLQEELKNLTDAWDAVVFTLQHGGSWMEFESRVTRLTEYITQWSVGKRNYYSHSNKVFAEKLKEFGKVLKDIAIVIDAVRDIYHAAKEIDQMRHAVDQFPSRKAQFLQQYAYFQKVADNFGHYHEGKECQPEKWPDPEYQPPFDGPYPYPRILQSCDPNEMVGPSGLGDPETQRFVKPGEELTYTIYFENKTNATAAAQEVYVTNSLSQYLDWSTFKMHEVAFGDQIDLGLVDKSSGTSEVTMKGTNFVVRTELVLEENGDAGTRDACPYQAKWYMRIVDPTTDTGWPKDIVAGFLPPNDETHRGEGHITYSICVREDAPANLVISNSADIVFDHNPSIKTDPAWWNTVSPIDEFLQAGEYFKAMLAELGYDVPTDGTPYSVVAKGLPAGLKLVGNKAVKDKKGKITKKANVEWWIEGVPTAPLDFMTNPPYLVITVNGETRTETLPVDVKAQEVVDLGELELGQSINTNGWLAGVGAGWTVSGLPTGLKYATKKVTKTTGSGKKKVTTTVAEAYAVYGKTTKAGLFTITAKRKVGGYYETLKYRVLVKPAPVDTALFGEELANITTMAYVPFEWDLTNDVAAVGGKVAKVAGLPNGVTFAAATTYKDKKKTQVKQYGQTIVGTPTKPGTYVVTFTKNVTTGTGKKKKTVAKTAQILWTVTANDANLELAFNIAGGVIEGGSVGLKYGDLMAFTATDGAAVTASGLPKGITLANLGGGSYAFTGFTTKAGTYLVTVKATLNGKTVTQRVALKVDGLPSWAKGTFNGYIAGEGDTTNGLATVTVSSVGKISGKFYEGGTNWTFTAASYTGYDDAAPAYSVPVVAKYAYKATEIVKGKKKTVTKSVARNFTLRVGQDALGGMATLEEVDGSTVEAWQNLWGSTYKAIGKKLFYTSAKKPYRVFTINAASDVGAQMGLLPTEKLSLKVTTAGAVTATMSFDTGKTSKGKAVIYKPTCSTVVIPLSAADAEEFEGEAILFFAPSTASGFPGFAGAAPF